MTTDRIPGLELENRVFPLPQRDVASLRDPGRAMTAGRSPAARPRRSEPAAVAGSENRAKASRRNGGKAHGPRSVAGKARSARNALKHGLSARRLVLLDGEDPAEFRAFARALQAELAPAGTLQADLVGRIAIATWRARRADQLEAAVLTTFLDASPLDAVFSTPSADPGRRRGAEKLGIGLIRDNHGPRAFATLVRYRGSVLAELFRSLAALKMLQAATAAPAAERLPLALPPANQTNPRNGAQTAG